MALSIIRTYCQVCLFLCGTLIVTDCVAVGQASPEAKLTPLTASFGDVRPHSVRMTGTVTVYSGSTAEQGSVLLIAKENAESHIFMKFAAEERDEEHSGTATQPACRIAAAQKEDKRTTPNCWLSVPWFFPQMAFLDLNQSTVELNDSGLLSEDGVSSHIFQISRILGTNVKSPADAKQMKAWSKASLDLIPETLLPRRLTYSLHGDRNILSVIAVKVTFSDYELIGGIQIPHHIKRYLNNALQADILISSAEVE